MLIMVRMKSCMAIHKFNAFLKQVPVKCPTSLLLTYFFFTGNNLDCH